MEQVTSNVFVETGIRGCNPGFVTTSDGIVLIDTPQSPSDAVKWRAEIESHGDVRYIINTEPHGDHWTGNAFFNAPVIAQEGVRERVLGTNMEERIARFSQESAEDARLFEGYRVNAPVLTFGDEMTLHVGDHTFHMIHMPGHTTCQAAIVIEEEGVVFTSDNVFCGVQTFIQEGNPDHWLQSLERLREVSAEVLVPGHGAVTDKSYLDEQGAFITEWMDYVRGGIEQGMTKEQAIERLTGFTERYPTDVGHDGRAPMIMRINVSNLYDYTLGLGKHQRA